MAVTLKPYPDSAAVYSFSVYTAALSGWFYSNNKHTVTCRYVVSGLEICISHFGNKLCVFFLKSISFKKGYLQLTLFIPIKISESQDTDR